MVGTATVGAAGSATRAGGGLGGGAADSNRRENFGLFPWSKTGGGDFFFFFLGRYRRCVERRILVTCPETRVVAPLWWPGPSCGQSPRDAGLARRGGGGKASQQSASPTRRPLDAGRADHPPHLPATPRPAGRPAGRRGSPTESVGGRAPATGGGCAPPRRRLRSPGAPPSGGRHWLVVPGVPPWRRGTTRHRGGAPPPPRLCPAGRRRADPAGRDAAAPRPAWHRGGAARGPRGARPCRPVGRGVWRGRGGGRPSGRRRCRRGHVRGVGGVVGRAGAVRTRQRVISWRGRALLVRVRQQGVGIDAARAVLAGWGGGTLSVAQCRLVGWAGGGGGGVDGRREMQ